jgi:hypothetical protein
MRTRMICLIMEYNIIKKNSLTKWNWSNEMDRNFFQAELMRLSAEWNVYPRARKMFINALEKKTEERLTHVNHHANQYKSTKFL